MSLEHEEQLLDAPVGRSPREKLPVYDFWTIQERLHELGISEEHFDRHMPSDPEDFANNT